MTETQETINKLIIDENDRGYSDGNKHDYGKGSHPFQG